MKYTEEKKIAWAKQYLKDGSIEMQNKATEEEFCKSYP